MNTVWLLAPQSPLPRSQSLTMTSCDSLLVMEKNRMRCRSRKMASFNPSDDRLQFPFSDQTSDGNFNNSLTTPCSKSNTRKVQLFSSIWATRHNVDGAIAHWKLPIPVP